MIPFEHPKLHLFNDACQIFQQLFTTVVSKGGGSFFPCFFKHPVPPPAGRRSHRTRTSTAQTNLPQPPKRNFFRTRTQVCVQLCPFFLSAHARSCSCRRKPWHPPTHNPWLCVILPVLTFVTPPALQAEDAIFEPLAQSFHSAPITGLDICIRKPLVASCSKDKTVRPPPLPLHRKRRGGTGGIQTHFLYFCFSNFRQSLWFFCVFFFEGVFPMIFKFCLKVFRVE